MTSPGKSHRRRASSPPKAAHLMEQAPHHRPAGGRCERQLVGALNVHDLLRAGVL